jgi:hypothetical protein
MMRVALPLSTASASEQGTVVPPHGGPRAVQNECSLHDPQGARRSQFVISPLVGHFIADSSWVIASWSCLR